MIDKEIRYGLNSRG